MCSGNTISSEDIDCSSGGYNNKPNIFNIVGNSFDDCCRGRCSEQICGAPNLETNNGLCSGLDCTDSECCSVPSGRTTNLYWVKGNPGEDCNTVCSANSMICSDVPANSGDLYSWAGASGGDSDDVRNYIADNTYVSGTNQLVPLNICRAGSSSSASTSHVVPSIRTQNSQDPSCFMPEQIEGHRFASCPANRTNYSRICRCQGWLKYLPEYPEIKITKIFYNLLDIDRPYTVKIRGIYEKKLSKKEKDMILEFIEKNKNYIEKIEIIFTDLQYINIIKKHLNKLLIVINNI